MRHQALAPKLMRTLLLASVLASVLAGSLPAQAGPFTLNLNGVVSSVNFDPVDPLGGAVQAGTPMLAVLNFDSDAVDAAPGPNLGSFTVGGGTLGFAAVVGSVLFPVLRTVNISVVDGVGGGPDQYTVFASEGVQDGLSDYFSASILLQDDGGTAIAGDALPLTLPDLSQFGVRSFALSGQYTNLDGVFMQYEVLGQLTPVDAPGTLALLGAAVAATAGLRGRRLRPGRSRARVGRRRRGADRSWPHC